MCLVPMNVQERGSNTHTRKHAPLIYRYTAAQQDPAFCRLGIHTDKHTTQIYTRLAEGGNIPMLPLQTHGKEMKDFHILSNQLQ